MTIRTVELVTYDHYLNNEYGLQEHLAGARAADHQEHQLRLSQFPYNVVLRLSYPEMDFANRWLWQQFGPPNGECIDSYSEYPTCSEKASHAHDGKWLSHWLAKTDYDFGYNEWCFEFKEDQQRFLEFVPFINFGEKYPK
jgi:hypothetical protein